MGQTYLNAPRCWVADRQGQHGRCANDIMPREWIAETDMLGRMYLCAPFLKYELLRNKLAMCELMRYEMIVDLCYEIC